MQMEQKITLKKLAINDRKKYLELFLIADESEAMVVLYLNEGEADLIQLKGETVGVVLFTDFTSEKAHSFRGGMIVSSDWGDPCGSYMSDNTTILVLFFCDS